MLPGVDIGDSHIKLQGAQRFAKEKEGMILMASAQVLKCKSREVKNTGYLKQLKRDEWVPGIIYGKNNENLTILLAKKELSKIFSRIGTRGIFSLDIEGKKQAIMTQVRDTKEPHKR